MDGGALLPNCGSWTTGLVARTGGEKPAWPLLESAPCEESFLLRIRSSMSQAESGLYGGSAQFDLGMALFTETAKGIRAGRRGWGQRTSVRGGSGSSGASICHNLDLLSGTASALEIGCLK